MNIEEVDSSVLNIEIILSLLDGKTKSAYDIAIEWSKHRMEDKYRKKCNDHVKKGLLYKYPLKKRKGFAYSLNFNIIIEHLENPIIKANKKYTIWFLNNLERIDNKVKKGDYEKFIKDLRANILSYLTKEGREHLIKRQKLLMLGVLAFGKKQSTNTKSWKKFKVIKKKG